VSTAPRKVQKPIDSVLVTGSRAGGRDVSWSGSYGAFQDYYTNVSGRGLTPATRSIPQVTVTAPRQTPSTTLPPSVIVDDTPKTSSPPVDDDFGSGDPSDWPPFEDPNDPFIPPKDSGSAEPPEDASDEPENLPTVVVEAPLPVAPTWSDAAYPFDVAVPAPRPRTPRPAPRRRRTKPAVPRRRPLRRPSPGPRIPIVEPLPEVAVTARRALPILGVLTLVPWYIGVLGRVDRYGTQHTFDRMYGAPGTRKDDDRANDSQRPRSPDPDTAGDPAAPGEPIDEVIVTGTRPSPFPAPPSLFGAPLTDPGVDYYPPVNRFIRPDPTRLPRQRPGPRFSVGPETVGSPYVLPLSPPFYGPNPVRPSSPAPKPGTPSAPGAPSFTPSPSTPIIGRIDPVPDLGPIPLEQLDKCNCPRPKTRKKRTPRSECWKGTYIEKATGISKTRRVPVDCATGAEVSRSNTRPSPMKKPKGGWPTNLKDLLNPKR